jgi:hypothetical protein
MYIQTDNKKHMKNKEIENVATVSFPKEFVAKMKIYVTKRGMKIRTWLYEVANEAMKKGE